MAYNNDMSYDRELLVDAPEASRAARQEGYNVTLLDGISNEQHSASLPSPHPISRSTEDLAFDPLAVDLEPNRRKTEKYETLNSSSSYDPWTAKKKPFWRTRKGIIFLIILAIIVVGAIVGGAVGGTVGKHSSSSNKEDNVSNGVQSSQATSSGTSTTASSDSTTSTTSMEMAPIGSGTLPTGSQSTSGGRVLPTGSFEGGGSRRFIGL